MSTTQSESESDSDSDDSKSDEGNGDEKEREDIENEMIDVKALKFERIGFKNTDKILKKNSFKLKKLSRGWCYVLRLRSKNDLGWSEWSECVKVITKNETKWEFQENEWLW